MPMRARPDIVVFSPDDRIQLVVEVKNHPGASEEWATRFRRNLVAHSVLPDAEFFLLALPDDLFLWKNSQDSGDAAPTYRISTAEALEPFRMAGSGEAGLEMAVNAWLNVLTSPDLGVDEVARSYRWLVDSGLYQRIRGGHVAYQAAA